MRDQSGNYLAVIKVVGVGGGGERGLAHGRGRALRGRVHRREHRRAGAPDERTDVKIHIGSKETRGLGAGADPAVGEPPRRRAATS